MRLGVGSPVTVRAKSHNFQTFLHANHACRAPRVATGNGRQVKQAGANARCGPLLRAREATRLEEALQERGPKVRERLSTTEYPTTVP
jgi:hypothetical protein